MLHNARIFVVALLGFMAIQSHVLIKPAAAQDFATLTELRRELELAKKEYNALDFDAATNRLREASRFIEQHDITDPVAAQIWIMLGLIQFNLTESIQDAREPFINALYIDREARVPAIYTTDQLDLYLDQLRDNLPKQELRMRHEPVDIAREGQQLPFRVTVPKKMPVYSVRVLIRRNGEPDFAEFLLNPTSSTLFERALAGAEVVTSHLDYYIEALDRGGKVVDRIASPDVPIRVPISGATFETIDQAPTKEELEERNEPATVAYFKGRVGMAIVVLAANDVYGTLYRDLYQSGNTSIEPLNLSLEGGYTFNPYHRIGLSIRYAPPIVLHNSSQIIPDKTLPQSGPGSEKDCLGTGLPGDCQISVTYGYSPILRPSYRLDLLAAVGIGRYRTNVTYERHPNSASVSADYSKRFSSYNDCGSKPKSEYTYPNSTKKYQACKIEDTVRPGWVVVGVGVGFAYRFTPALELGGDLKINGIFPTLAIGFDLGVAITTYF